jgi:hypothetical protein
MVHYWIQTTKFQNELLSLMKANGNAKLLNLNVLSHWKLQDPKCIVLIVSSYKSLGMAKRDFNLVLRLWNRQITSLRSNDPCWSYVRVAWIVTFSRGKRTTCGMLLSSSLWHYKNLGGPFVKWGREKINPFVRRGKENKIIPLWDSSIHILGQKKAKFCSKKKHWSKHVWS